VLGVGVGEVPDLAEHKDDDLTLFQLEIRGDSGS
jgi:hypothetical protein